MKICIHKIFVVLYNLCLFNFYGVIGILYFYALGLSFTDAPFPVMLLSSISVPVAFWLFKKRFLTESITVAKQIKEIEWKSMILKILSIDYIEGYKVAVQFNDGRQGTVDLSESLKGPVFKSLKNISEFKKCYVGNDLETITWPNGADLAPEYVYFMAFKNESKLQSLFQQWGYI